MRRVRPLAFSTLATALLTACGGGTGPDCAEPALAEPVLTIRSASSAADGTAIPRLTLSNFQVDGGHRDVESIATFENASLQNGSLICDVPCGFGVEQGTWSFDVRAEGFAPHREERRAWYKVKPTECGDDVYGTKIDITLEPG